MPSLAATLTLPPGVDIAPRIGGLLDAGFESLVLEPPFFSFQVEETFGIIDPRRVAAIRLFLPYPRGFLPDELRPDAPLPFWLGASDGEIQRDTLAQGQETIVFAARHSIPFVLVPPGRREEPGQAPLSSYLRTLESLAALAERYDVRLALTPSPVAEGLPSADDMETCFRELAGAPLCVWADPALEFRANRRTLWQSFSANLSGVTVRYWAAGEASQTEWEPCRPLLDSCPLWRLYLDTAYPREAPSIGFEFLESLARGPEQNPFV